VRFVTGATENGYEIEKVHNGSPISAHIRPLITGSLDGNVVKPVSEADFFKLVKLKLPEAEFQAIKEKVSAGGR